ncbi:protocadherin Fat 4-like isoform X3 [Symsagittifera roscoffensis]|uniref:protocadherin Fat 4-like isoform X3 n=1 Tax=Symsagittifera roscoffensis TaxID=84072 RepID=UPI00307B9310
MVTPRRKERPAFAIPTWLSLLMIAFAPGSVHSAITVSNAPYTISENANMNAEVAQSNIDINVCTGVGIDCTATLPRVKILNPPAAENPFGISDNGRLYVANPDMLDFEDSGRNTFLVSIAVTYGNDVARASDQFRSFTVNVVNFNEPPEWIDSPTAISVQEQTATLAAMANFIFLDPETDAMTCTLGGAACTAKFTLTATAGRSCVLATSGVQTFDYETTTTYTCTVKVCETANPVTKCSSTNDFFVEVLDVDEEPPHPNANETFATVVAADAGTGIALAPVITYTDADSEHFYFTIEDSTHPNATAGDVDNFIVDATTGVIRFKEDATPAKVYHVDLYATDYNGNKTPYPVVCEITVTVSNNLPPACAKDWVLLKMTDEITQLTVNLKTGVTGPQCADPEGGALSFTAETTSGEIGGVTYTLSAAGVFSTTMDRETLNQYELVVYVKDAGVPILTTTITLAVVAPPRDDNVPVLTDGVTRVDVEEGLPAGTQVIGPRTWSDVDASEAHSEVFFGAGTFTGDCPSETLFQVDPEDGALYLVKSFDFNANYVNHYLERSCVYTPKVCVPAGCQDAALTTTIRLQNVNDHAPVINSLDKTVTIDEDETVGTGIYTITVRDYDVSSFTYQISGDALAKEYFQLDTSSLEVLKVPNLDNGGPNFFDITLFARDYENSPGDLVHVYVNVDPVEEFDPEFDKNSYTAQLVENANQVGSSVASLQLYDFDIAPHGVDQIQFAITAGDDDNNFYVEAVGLNPTLHTVWADVRVKKVVDFEQTGNTIALTITATGSGTAATVPLTITVEDKPDVYSQCPDFFLATGAASLNEASAVPGTTNVGTVIVCTPATGLTFKSTHPNFAFSGNQMKVAADAVIDYETEQMADFYIVVTDNAGFFAHEIPARVEIGPANEFSPTFYPSTIADVTVDENSPIGTLVASVEVKDEDLFTSHEIDPASLQLANTYGGRFAITKVEIVNGYSIQVVVADELDAETSTGPYSLSLEAADADNSPSLDFDVYVRNVDEFAPTCTKTAFSVTHDEDIAAGSDILSDMGCTDAADQGGSVSYSIASDPSGLFEVTTTVPGGRIKLKAGKTLEYDVEGGKQHLIVVDVIDSSLRVVPVCVIVNVNPINSATPTFAETNPSVNLRESTKAGTCFYQFTVSDSDWKEHTHGQFTFNTISASTSFLVDKYSGKVCLVKPVDYESGTISYAIQVTAQNADGTTSATNTLTVGITNDNDEEPECNHYVRGTQTEGTAANTNIVTLGCNDDDGDGATLAYVSSDSHFTITAAGMVQNAMVLSNAAKSVHTFYVTVTDSSGASVEGAPHTITVPVTVQVASADGGAPVCVTSATSVTTTSTYSASVNENAPMGTEVIQVHGKDLNDLESSDGIPLTATDTYSFRTGDAEADFFSIDPATGVMYVAAPIDLESASVTSPLVVDVVVTDGAANTVTCAVSVAVEDVNDHCPVFAQKSYQTSVDEETTTLTLVVSASDADDSAPANTVTYAITSSTATSGLFTIGSSSGALSITSAPNFDILQVPYYLLEVTASDNGGLAGFCQSTVTVGVTVNNKNDNAPVLNAATYTATVAENAPIGTVILDTITASDIDLGTDGEFYFDINPANSKFSIDRLTGVVHLAERLDVDPNNPTSTITITVGAYDNGTPQLSDTATLTITVEDSNDNAPLCVSYELSDSFLESTTLPHTTSATLSCSDTKDSSATLTYEILSVNGIVYEEFTTQSSTNFSISGSDELVVGGSLDYETEDSFIVAIGVLDTFAGDVLTVTVSAKITLTKDFATEPTFLLASGAYAVAVSESTAVETEILDLQSAMELEGYKVIYVKTSTTESKFAVNPNNGKVFVTDSLDRETDDSYTLNIDLILNSTHARTGITGRATAVVTITITDENDNPPTFNPKRYTTKIPETASAGTVVTALSVTDADQGPNKEIASMTITSGDPSGLFAVSQDFNIELIGSLDYDSSPLLNYTLIVEATDGGDSALIGTATVYVEVIPVNEAAPQFSMTSYSFTMSEDEEVGYFVGAVVATDSDRPRTTDGKFSYVIVSPAGGAGFWLDPENGTLILHQTLDYETPTSEVVLIVEARDFGYDAAYVSSPLTGTASVTVSLSDANDNSPDCGTNILFKTSVQETSTGPASDLDVFDLGILCSDADITTAFRTLSYSIGSYDPPSMTQLMITNEGMVYLPQNQPISFEQHENVTLNVVVTDNGGTCGGGACNQLNVEVFVQIVNVNQFAPVLTQPSSPHTVSEGDPIGTNIVLVSASDADNGIDGEFEFFIQSGNTHGDFELGYTVSDSTVNVTTARTLDRERTASYGLVIIATDKGTPPKTGTITVTINVQDVNEPPVCITRNYHVTLYEEDSSLTGNFLELQCFDSDSTTSGLNYAAVRYVINEEIQYPAGTSKTSDFTFEVDTGLALKNRLRIRTTKLPLDYETVTHYTLKMDAYDNLGVNPSNVVNISVFITVHNINDNLPVFDPITNCSISENHAVGLLSPACAITAQDADRAPYSSVTYRITDDSSSGKFAINSTTGDIYLKEAIDTDLYTLSVSGDIVFALTVEACDCDSNSTTRHCISDVIYISVSDVVDSDPECYPKYYEITLDDGDVSFFTTDGTFYFQQTIACSDTDFGDTLTYAETVSTGNAADWNMTGNKLSLLNVPDFDVGSQEYEIEIVVSDSTSVTATVSVFVHVNPVNEFDPTLAAASPTSCTVSECGSVPTTCMTMSFEDSDNSAHIHGQVSASITSGNSDSIFQLNYDWTTNTAVLRQNGPVDRETDSFYNMTVLIQDSDSYFNDSKSTVEYIQVYVTGCNDNYPIFNPQVYAVEVADTILDSQVIVTVSASDADVGGVGDTITYSYDSSDTPTNSHFTSLFELTNSNTEISLQAGQTLTAGDFYVLKMLATDNGSPPKETHASVSIHVSDASNSAPTLAAPSTFAINETDVVGTLVGSYPATDADSDQIHYSILSVTYTPAAKVPPVQPVFWIHPTSGDIYTAAPLDYEWNTQFVIMVEAMDAFNVTVSNSVTVNVLDINDNVVNCTRGSKNAVIQIPWSELSAVGSTYDLNTQVEDIDDPSATFVFTTLAGTDDYDALNPDFEMSSAGVISTLHTLDFERQSKYVWTVEITDGDTNPSELTTTCVVQIDLIDENEFGPHFEPEIMFVSVMENNTFPIEVLELSIVDRDGSSAQNTLFSSPLITSGDPLSSFLVQPNAGGVESLVVQTTLDRDTGVDKYKLLIEAKDTGTPPLTSTGTVFVTVEDVNDNPPVWNTSPIPLTIPECVGINQPIPAADLSAFVDDLDVGNNSVIYFRLVGGAVVVYWNVDQTTGALTATRSLDKEGSPKTWALTVEAYDPFEASHVASVVVNIDLSDCNDFAPNPLLSTYRYQIDAEVAANSVVNPINPSNDISSINDYDYDPVNRDLEWTIDGGVGNDTLYFYINNQTGVIYTKTSGALETNNKDNYTLFVRVNDGVFNQTFNVSIEVLFTANDHSPVFNPNQYSVSLIDSKKKGEVVLTLSATDADVRPTLTYSILAVATGSPISSHTQADDLFIIQAGSRVLEVRDDISYDSTSPNPFEFFVEVSDGLTTDTATVTITVYSSTNNPFFQYTYNGEDNLYAFTYITQFEENSNSQFVGRVRAFDVNDTRGSTVSFSLEETVYCDKFGIDDDGFVYVKNTETPEDFKTYWCFVTGFLDLDPTINNQATVRIDTCPAWSCAIRIRVDNPPTYDQLTDYDANNGQLLDSFNTDMTDRLRTVTGLETAYVQTVYTQQVSSFSASSKKKRRSRSAPDPSDTFIYIVAVRDNGTNSEDTVGAQTNFIPAEEFYTYLDEPGFGQDPFGPGDTYPIIPDSAAFLAQPAASSAKAWVQTGAGIATVVICCILGLALLGGLVALGLYMFARKETITIPESGPDMEARKNWKRAIRKAMLMSRLTTAKAIDPVSGRVYVYNKLTKATRWLKTKDGGEVPSNTALNPSHIDDPNPMAADSGGEQVVRTATLANEGASQGAAASVGAFRPRRARPAPIEEQEEEEE